VLRDFQRSVFFHQTIFPGSRIHLLNPLSLWIRILRGVKDTAGSDFFVEAICMWCLLLYIFLLWSLFKGLGSKNRFREWSRGVIKDPAVSLTPRNPNIFKRLSRFSRRIRSHMRHGFSPWIRALFSTLKRHFQKSVFCNLKKPMFSRF
jgi:hypothetical protein